MFVSLVGNKVVDEEGSLEGTATDTTNPFEDIPESRNQTKTKVMPTAVVNKAYRELFSAAVGGYWRPMERILKRNPEAITAEVMTVQEESYSMLDIAVMFAHDDLVDELVKRLSDSDVNILKNALLNAARTGRKRMVRALVDKVHAEPQIVEIALQCAAKYAPKEKDVISYLVKCTTSSPKYDTMRCLIMAGHLDIVLSLVERFGAKTSFNETENLSLLGDLVKMKSYFGGGIKLNFWENCFYKCINCLADTSNDDSEESKMTAALALKQFKKSLWNLVTKSAPQIKSFGESQLRRQRSFHFAIEALFLIQRDMEIPKILESLLNSGIVLDAASRGITEIVFVCLELYPELMWEKNFTKELTKEIVNGRHVDLFRLVNAFKAIPYLTDDKSTRHLMEALVESQPTRVPTDVSGAAFLMQRELQWFKVLEERSNPSLKSLEFKVTKDTSDPLSKSLKLEETKKRGGKTFWEVFVEEHQDLVKEAGQWMKDTSSSCSVVATLITTVAFAATFTVPGGNYSTGTPVFLKKGSFMVFAIADALALFSSVTATLMFLAILTSSYAIEDFLHSLPRKMILGLTFLFLSLAFMLVAFGSTLTIVLSEQFKWIYIPVILLAAFPVALFAILQLPLYVGMVKSTYRPPLFRPLKM